MRRNRLALPPVASPAGSMLGLFALTVSLSWSLSIPSTVVAQPSYTGFMSWFQTLLETPVPLTWERYENAEIDGWASDISKEERQVMDLLAPTLWGFGLTEQAPFT